MIIHAELEFNNVCCVWEKMFLLAYLTRRFMWGIIIYWRPPSSTSPSLNLCILIVFSETTGPIGTTFGIHFYWIIPTKFMGVSVDEKYTKETRGPNVSTWCVHINRYKLLIVHLFLIRIFCNAFRKNIPFININTITM